MDFNSLTQTFPFNAEKAAGYLQQWEELCRKDGGKLWGVNLRTPFVIIDEETRNVVANEDGFGDKYPEELTIGTTAIKHRGKFWATSGWNFAEWCDEKNRLELFVHEAFHALQPFLFGGEIDDMGQNDHLNELPAVVWFRVEMNTLLAAVKTEGEERLKSAHAALAARAQRREKYGPMAEAVWELMEGTADYTHLMIVDPDGYLAYLEEANNNLVYFDNRMTLPRNFGYISGAMYCYVLDALGVDWKPGLTWNSDLGEILATAIGTPATPPCLDDYGYSELLEEQKKQQAESDKQMQAIRDAFRSRPLLRCSLKSDRGGLVRFIQIAELGEIRRGIVQYNGDFGKMVVNENELEKAITSDGDLDFLEHNDGYCAVFAENLQFDGNKVIGDYWKLELNEGYEVVSVGMNYEIRVK